jgi:glutamate-5-semialdehyde dehydrogenase
MNKLPEDLTNFLYQSYSAGLSLSELAEEKRNQLILKIADAIKHDRNQILEANTYDLEASREMAIPDLLLDWMKLTPDRLHRTVDYLKHLAQIPSPLLPSATVIQGNHFRTIPVGSTAFIYEALPHLAVMMAGMCIKTGNNLILRGGTEVSHAQATITTIIQTAIRDSGFDGAADFVVAIAPTGTGIKDLVTQEKYLRLIIPYGRPSFVQQVSRQSTLAVLPAAMGNCYMYVGVTGSLSLALEIIKASHQGDPDAVNAIEKVIIPSSFLVRESLDFVKWLEEIKALGLKIKGCDRFVSYYRNYSEIFSSDIETENQWGVAYLADILAIKVVDVLPEAIAWINQYSSGHADVILSDSLIESQAFVSQVKASNIFVNAHSKFNRFEGDRLALGMVSLKTRGVRGIIDLQALTTTKRIITPKI